MPKTRKKTRMTEAHKAALAEGRNQSRAVKAYLEALEANKPKRGRKRTPESVKRRLGALEADIPTADPLKRVQLIQERMDLERELANKQGAVDLSALESAFVKVAKPYSESKGISYAAFRELGVAPDVLKRAGITRGG
ncbi:MAG: hypothetical protein ABI276_03770 [Acidimicrobiales bacterium]